MRSVCFGAFCGLFFMVRVFAAIVVTDDEGKTVSLAQPAQRVVSLSPHATEMLYAIGAAEELVGVTRYSEYPEQAKSLPVVGDFRQIDLEKVLVLKPDLIVLAGFLVNIPAEMVQAYRGRIINIHPSLIPSFCGKGYYGLKVHEGVLARGVKVTGATVHFVDEGTDTGPIICQKAVCVEQDDTPKVLQQRVMEEAEWQLLPRAIDWIANGRVQIQDGKVFIK